MAVRRGAGPGLDLRNIDSALYPAHQEAKPATATIPRQPPAWWGYFLCGLRGVAEWAGLAEGQQAGLDCLGNNK